MLKKIKRRLFSRKNGGFTLVEVIVSAALLGVLLVGIIAFITPTLKLMKSEETDSHASMVANTLENYITRSLRSTPYVKVVKNASFADFAAGSPQVNSGDVDEMLKWAEESANANIYEIRAISLRKTVDDRTGETKYMLYQSYFKDRGLSSDHDTLVFAPCFYDGLFPTVDIKQATNQYRDGSFPKNEDGTTQSLENRPAIELTLNVYDDKDMGQGSLVFSGTGLTELHMIAINDYDQAENKNSYGYKIYGESKVIEDDADAKTQGKEDIFIIYAARKLTTP